MASWHEHWNQHYRFGQSYGSCLTDAKYIVQNAEGKKSALETVCVFFSKDGDAANNRVICRYVGGKDEFELREKDIHKHIIGWK